MPLGPRRALPATRGQQMLPDFIEPSPWNMAALGFIIALMGWMPAPIEFSAINSLWVAVKRKLDHVLVLEVDDKALVDRIKGRAAETGGARTDDNEETLKKRLKVYHDQTAPILPYYEAKNLLRAIDGMQPVDEVTALIGKTLK